MSEDKKLPTGTGCEVRIDAGRITLAGPVMVDGTFHIPNAELTNIRVGPSLQFPMAAVEALGNYEQADAEGCRVIVSREALEEVLPVLRALAQSTSHSGD